MQIVIDIPEEIYDSACATNNIWNMRMAGFVCSAIASGTPLPKGHGRLKDFDKIEWYGCDFEGRGCIEAKGNCAVCNHANCYAKQVRELPTIIEADKAESEEV